MKPTETLVPAMLYRVGSIIEATTCSMRSSKVLQLLDGQDFQKRLLKTAMPGWFCRIKKSRGWGKKNMLDTPTKPTGRRWTNNKMKLDAEHWWKETTQRIKGKDMGVPCFFKEGIGKWLCKHRPNSKGVAVSLSTKLQDTLHESNSEFTPENQWVEDEVSFWGKRPILKAKWLLVRKGACISSALLVGELKSHCWSFHPSGVYPKSKIWPLLEFV